jgi:hypothetical protein
MSAPAHGLALTLTLLAHVAAVLLVLISRPLPTSPVAVALQITWIDPAPAPQPAEPPMPTQMPVRTETREIPRAPRAAAPDTPADIAPDPPTPEPSRPLSAIFIEQGKALERAQDGADFVHNPLAERRGRLEVPRERIAMRDPMTPAQVVAAVGQLFGGPGYETSPCPRIRRNIAALGPGGDSAALREELTRYQRDCER